jgi:hypothetical protein
MDIAAQAGSVALGKKAYLNICPPGVTPAYLPYAFGQQHLRPINIHIKE